MLEVVIINSLIKIRITLTYIYLSLLHIITRSYRNDIK